GFRRKLVVTESVFSMDGDKAPLKELAILCERHGALLMVDEAHATGLFGSHGQGLAQEAGLAPDIQMGTLGKAVGVCGAYVAGSRALVELLVNMARSLIYTTALSPALIGAALAALKIISAEEGQLRRARLRENTETFYDLLPEELRPPAGSSHIVPVCIGDSARTMKISEECLRKGIFAHGIRYPTVPEGTARLRFTLMSDHTTEDLQKAVEVLRSGLKS
ncbi:MAG: aminotransferase class I/II-fold pyridoxal phosphate-dependent enzyme, partial [Deltaproteobacteria bacterium]|nr:aminotransferase class I/II-fold pyridoxal phosphate-dependent enzyme [Deltaproteobacteria bacterium]